MTDDFESFGKIEKIGKLYMSITEKIHGTNAQIYIYSDEHNNIQLKAGSRTRWLTPEDDNFGFAKFCYSNKDELIDKLGQGRHFGEWAGKGINAGYNLAEKVFFLFNWKRWKQEALLSNVSVVPILYSGKMSFEKIQETMDYLKYNGSRISAGYMNPEGIVVEIGNNIYKKTFDTEEIKWGGKDPNKIIIQPDSIDVSHLLQPIRLEKLLSRDSRYIENYPESIADIVSDYVKDLVEEGQIIGSEEEIKAMKKYIGKYVFNFIRSIVAEM